MNQQHSEGQWYLLGRYTLDANSQVSLPGQTDGYTVADALQLESTSAPSQIDYLHPDHLGTVRAITDANQTVIWRWDSTPFGDTLPEEDPDGDGQALRFNLRFPGQYFDAETGLHYNYFRDYDPATGRYVQSDPIGLAGGINTYAYVGGNPLILSDALGLAPFNPADFPDCVPVFLDSGTETTTDVSTETLYRIWRGFRWKNPSTEIGPGHPRLRRPPVDPEFVVDWYNVWLARIKILTTITNISWQLIELYCSKEDDCENTIKWTIGPMRFEDINKRISESYGWEEQETFLFRAPLDWFIP